MKWSLVSQSCSDDWPDVVRGWFIAAGQQMTDGLTQADAHVVVADSWPGVLDDLPLVQGRPYVLVDASEGAAVVEQCAAAPPVGVIATSVATSVAHYASHSATVLPISADASLGQAGAAPTGALVVGGPGTSPADVEPVVDALAHLAPCFVASCPASVRDALGASLGSAPEDVRIGDGLRHPDVGLVLILAGSTLVPDVALAFGRRVVSERAPLLVDWALVPTIVERAVGARSAPTLADVIADDVLLNWLTEAASHEVRSHFAVVSAEDAVATVVEIVGRAKRAEAGGLGRAADYLNAAGLERGLLTIATEP